MADAHAWDLGSLRPSDAGAHCPLCGQVVAFREIVEAPPAPAPALAPAAERSSCRFYFLDAEKLRAFPNDESLPHFQERDASNPAPDPNPDANPHPNPNP